MKTLTHVPATPNTGNIINDKSYLSINLDFFFLEQKTSQKFIIFQMSMYFCHLFILLLFFFLRYFALLFERLEEEHCHLPANSASKAETETACPQAEGYIHIMPCQHLYYSEFKFPLVLVLSDCCSYHSVSAEV